MKAFLAQLLEKLLFFKNYAILILLNSRISFTAQALITISFTLSLNTSISI